MPCRMEGYEYNYGIELKKEIDTLTRYLCEAITLINKFGFASNLSLEIHEWKIQHDLEDLRIKNIENEILRDEQTKKSALDKLTKEERKLLGLD